MIDLYTLTVIAFFAIIAILIYRNRKKVEIKLYIVFMSRSKNGLKFLDKMARYKMFWKILGTIGILIAFYLMFTGVYVLTEYGRLLLTGQVKQPGLSFVFPSPSSEFSSGPGYILIPFWFWIVIIASVIFPHEVFHGILSRVEKIRVKSFGLMLFAIFPGAFVEPDEKQLKKGSLITKLRIFAAGSFANFVVYLLILLLVSNVIWPTYVPGPVVLDEINQTSPLGKAGLEPGMVVTSINGKDVKVTYDNYLKGPNSYLSEQLSDLKPDQNITIVADQQTFHVTVGRNATNNSVPYLGLNATLLITGTDTHFASSVLFPIMTWIWILNYTIAIVNISPIYPLDGGLMVQAIAEKVYKKRAKIITMIITLIMLAIFALNIVTPFLLRL